ncbi:MAG: hypothetical protein AAGK97_06960 [Bacteroidota bacterium]
MKFKYLGLFAFLTVATLFVFSSCQKDDLKEDSTLETQINSDFDAEIIDYRGGRGNLIRSRCFKIVFPILLNNPDGTTVTVNNYREMFVAFRDWVSSNPDSDDRPSIAYPIMIRMRMDSTEILVGSSDELSTIADSCRMSDRDRPHNRCFSLVYPVNIDYPDGSNGVAFSREELHTMVRDWIQNNPDQGRPSLGFPLTVMLRNGTDLVINNSDEFDALKVRCRQGNDRPNVPSRLFDLGCYTLQFPATLEFPNGELATVDSNREMIQSIRDWYTNNPDADEKPELVFPFDIENRRTGDIVNIENQDDLDAAIADCGR